MSFFVLGALIVHAAQTGSEAPADAAADEATAVAAASNAAADAAGDRHAAYGSLHALGRSLFGDYLFAVELGGTLLLVATIGAIAIAPRRREGTL